MLVKLGTKTKWGRVAAVGSIGGERHYWMVKEATSTKALCVSMMPADMVESDGQPA